MDLRKGLQHAMLHLLDSIRNPIGSVHFDRPRLLVYRELVPAQVEGVVGESEVLDGPILAEGIVVEVTCVEPSADVETRYALSGLVGRLGGRPHPVAVEVSRVGWRLQSVVHVRKA